MFHHPALAVGSHSSGPLAAGTVGTKSMGRFYQADVSPCTMFITVKIKIFNLEGLATSQKGPY